MFEHNYQTVPVESKNKRQGNRMMSKYHEIPMSRLSITTKNSWPSYGLDFNIFQPDHTNGMKDSSGRKVDSDLRSDVPMQQNMIEVEFPDMMDEIPEDRGDEVLRCGFQGVRRTRLAIFFRPNGRSSQCLMVWWFDVGWFVTIGFILLVDSFYIGDLWWPWIQ